MPVTGIILAPLVLPAGRPALLRVATRWSSAGKSGTIWEQSCPRRRNCSTVGTPRRSRCSGSLVRPRSCGSCLHRCRRCRARHCGWRRRRGRQHERGQNGLAAHRLRPRQRGLLLRLLPRFLVLHSGCAGWLSRPPRQGRGHAHSRVVGRQRQLLPQDNRRVCSCDRQCAAAGPHVCLVVPLVLVRELILSEKSVGLKPALFVRLPLVGAHPQRLVRAESPAEQLVRDVGVSRQVVREYPSEGAVCFWECGRHIRQDITDRPLRAAAQVHRVSRAQLLQHTANTAQPFSWNVWAATVVCAVPLFRGRCQLSTSPLPLRGFRRVLRPLSGHGTTSWVRQQGGHRRRR